MLGSMKQIGGLAYSPLMALQAAALQANSGAPMANETPVNTQTPVYNTAVNLTDGQLNIPNPEAAEDQFTITVNTGGATGTANYSIFDHLFSRRVTGRFTGNPTGTVYSKSPNVNEDLMPLIREKLANHAFFFDVIRITATNADTQEPVDVPFSVIQHVVGNAMGEGGFSNINVKNGINPANFKTNIVDFALRGKQRRIDKQMDYVLQGVPAGIKLEILFLSSGQTKAL